MSKKITPSQNAANIGNANIGTPGQNLQHAQNQGNRGRQMDKQNGKSAGQGDKKK